MLGCHVTSHRIQTFGNRPAERRKREYRQEQEGTLWMEQRTEDVRVPMRKADNKGNIHNNSYSARGGESAVD